jgi:hypothetical protein
MGLYDCWFLSGLRVIDGCRALYCCAVLGGCTLGGELLTTLSTCIVLSMKSIATIGLGDLHLKGIFAARCIDLRIF